MDNVLIENNHIERCDKCGIVVRGCKRNLNISHNYMENIGGDGILASGCYKGMIEHNVAKRTCMRSGYMDLKGGETWWPHTAAIWIMNAQETVMQYNEVYDTGRQPGTEMGLLLILIITVNIVFYSIIIVRIIMDSFCLWGELLKI